MGSQNLTLMYNPIGCPRCGQLLLGNSDHHGEYQSCIQCGYYKDVIKKIVIPESMKGHRKPGRKGNTTNERPNRIVEVDKFLNEDRQTKQIIKKGNNSDNIRS